MGSTLIGNEFPAQGTNSYRVNSHLEGGKNKVAELLYLKVYLFNVFPEENVILWRN